MQEITRTRKIMTKNKLFIPAFSIILTFLLFIFQFYSLQSPEVIPASAPDDEFSGARAYQILENLLSENKPHPVGSKLNKEVKKRITSELNKLGVSFEEQRTWACGSRFNNCAPVENIIATIPGSDKDSVIALMAHYDSVEMAPGAGDDGAAVAAILETTRALLLDAPFKNSIMLIFTDGEEAGLLGAEAFFKQHPLAKTIDLLLNFEGSGTKGGSMILRTTEANELLINAYSESSGSPYGFSFVKEIFKRMPNDTDFSVVMRAGVDGMDFAFAGERNHYHSPNDNLENIDLGTIQHHGENMLPLTRTLADMDIDELGNNVVYGGTIYGIWSHWASSNSYFLILLSLFLIGLGSFKLKPSIKGISLGFLFSPAILLSTILFGFLGFKFVELITGTVISWPGIDLPYRLLLISSTSLGALIAINLINRFVNQTDQVTGVWIFWWVLSFLCVLFLPDAANLLIIPTLMAGVFLSVAGFIKPDLKAFALLGTLVFAVPSTLGLIYSLEQSQGYRLILVVLPLIGLYAIALSPLLHGINLKKGMVVSLVGIIVSLSIVAYKPLYTEWRPQHVNINYIENLDSGTATYNLQSQNPISENLKSSLDFQQSRKALLPYTNRTSSNWAETLPTNWQKPDFKILNESIKNNQREIEIEIRSLRAADKLLLAVPANSQLRKFKLNEIEYEAVLSRYFSDDFFAIRLVGVYEKPIVLTLTFDSSALITGAYLADISTELPANAEKILKNRTKLSVPSGHGGDTATLFRSISF